MKKYYALLCMLCLLPLGLGAQNAAPAPLKHEVRAAWVTTLSALDWPKARATTSSGIQRQKAELIEILDRLKAANFNTVLIQTRVRGDVIYKSAYEPFNSIFTGRVNGGPGYDPLAFAVEECHKRGMECHAWFVAIPLGSHRYVSGLGSHSVSKKRKGLTVSYKNNVYMNPGNPQTKEYLWEMTREIISNYDVDGVHYDYMRYPERAPNFPDRAEYRKYGKGRDINQWRRDNITAIVRYIYNGVKSLKPWVKVSTSPVGKFGDTSRYSSNGWNAYATVMQDVKGWLAEGIQDQIYPMMYFRGNAFYPFALDWAEQAGGRHVVPGLGIYFLDPKEGNWSIDEVERQINFARTHRLDGQAYYRVRYLMNNVQGLYDVLGDNFYAAKALVPPMPWIDAECPTTPQNLRGEELGDGYTRLSWEAATDNDRQNKPRYNIYASDTYPVNTEDPRNIVAQNVEENHFTHVAVLPWLSKRFFAVTATDRCGNESQAAQLSAQPQ